MKKKQFVEILVEGKIDGGSMNGEDITITKKCVILKEENGCE